MNTSTKQFVMRHVLVALDGSAHSLAALQLATELAAGAKAQLRGLFVEDSLLLRLATSPHAREVLYPAAQQHALNTATMEQSFHAQAEQARKALSSSAEHAQVRWSFRVVRGEVTAEVLAAASDADILALGKKGWSMWQRLHLGSTALAVTHGAPRAVLLVQHCAPFRRQVLVFDKEGPSSPQLLSAAAHLAAAYGNTLVVLFSSEARAAEVVPADVEKGADLTVSEASRLLQQEREHLHVHFHRLPSADALSIAHAVRAEGGGILLIEEAICLPETIRELLRHLDSPILLVRG